MNCFYCSTTVPDQALFCPNCANQLKCRSCKEALIKEAKICIYCGEQPVNVKTNNEVNTIDFSETKSGRTFKATFTDTVGQSISDAFGMILANKFPSPEKKVKPMIALPVSEVNNNNSDEAIEAIVVEDESGELNQFKKIFKTDGERTTLSETRLKAKSKRDYGIRLSILFLYYKSLTDQDFVPRKELTAILQNASVEDGNLRHWLANNPLIGISDDLVELKAPGKDKAREFLADILNTELKDHWQIGTSNRSKKGNKREEKV